MITPDRMAAVDENAAALGVPRKQLMESSGNAVAAAVRRVATPGARVALVCGRGNNGGDAFVAARFLDSYDPTVHLLGRPESIATDIARENWEALRTAEYDARVVRDSRALDLNDPDVIVDAMLGTGVTGALRQPERDAAKRINASEATVVSVDVPSGIDAATGEATGVAVDADRVITFHDMKPGLDGGDVTVADIGIPETAELFVGPGDRRPLSRPSDAHKGAFGEVLVVGGGPYTGAPALAGQAAMRAGADLVRVACPESVAREVQAFEAGLIVRPFDGDRLTPEILDRVLSLAAGHDTVVVGPGLGDSGPTLSAIREFLTGYDGRAVVDADALEVVPEVDTDATLLCTPHAGELRAMGGPAVGDNDWRERLNGVAEFAADLGHTLLVKGAYDAVTDGERRRVNRTGNPGMTVGGTGDVLAGAAGALLATVGPLNAGGLAAYATGLAGDRVADREGHGLLASDLLDELPRALWGDRDE
ncbi:NAD(P)H-hydrate dehydratase [Haloplanus sp.]|uniref:NAD(P)H-hydrate dehydratase n=1 Tax=Haloplanus sp. TaxID=1961696 RepID=UPI00261655B3|nr:NAD(P)H-hydrate dehydratase [Haloplanus sp.]